MTLMEIYEHVGKKFPFWVRNTTYGYVGKVIAFNGSEPLGSGGYRLSFRFSNGKWDWCDEPEFEIAEETYKDNFLKTIG